MNNFFNGNTALRKKQYEVAITHYLLALENTSARLGKVIGTNIALARRHYIKQQRTPKRFRVGVFYCSFGQSSLERVQQLIQYYQTFAEVEIIICGYHDFNDTAKVFFNTVTIPIRSFIVQDPEQFIIKALHIAAHHNYDIVHLVNPRIVNIIIGVLYKLSWGAAVIMDISDNDPNALTPNKVNTSESYFKDEFKWPIYNSLFSEEWTQIAYFMINECDAVTVANSALQKNFGGEWLNGTDSEQTDRLYKLCSRVFEQRRPLSVKHWKLLRLINENKIWQPLQFLLAPADMSTPSLIQESNLIYKPLPKNRAKTNKSALGRSHNSHPENEKNITYQLEKQKKTTIGVSFIINITNQNYKDLDQLLKTFFELNNYSVFELFIIDNLADKRKLEIVKKYITKAFICYVTSADSAYSKVRYSKVAEIYSIDDIYKMAHSVKAPQTSKNSQVSKSGISIIILTKDAAEYIDKLLSTFFATNTYKPVELIIIDHASKDNSRQVVEKFMSKGFVSYIKRDKNYSFAESCNFAAGKAKYQYLLFMNNDIFYTSDVLHRAQDVLEKDQSVGAVGIRLDDPIQESAKKEQAVQHLGIEFRWNEKRGYHQPEQIRHPSLKEYLSSLNYGHRPLTSIIAVTAAFLLCRKTDFKKLSGFDESYNYGLEDIDFCLRLGRELKKHCYCINDLGLQHADMTTRNKWDKKTRTKIIEENHRIFKERWGEYISDQLLANNKRSKKGVTPSYKPLPFFPACNVEQLTDDEYEWRATTNDPQFTVELIDSLLKKPGWYSLRIHLKTQLLGCNAKAYFDTGGGYNEKNVLSMSAKDDFVLNQIFYVDDKVVKLRFDPIDKAGKFTIKDISLCKLYEIQAKKYMLDSLQKSGKYKHIEGKKKHGYNLYDRVVSNDWSSINKIYHEYKKLYLPQKDVTYSEWIVANDTISSHDRYLIKHHINNFKIRPKFSIIVPVYDTRPGFLRQAIDSVKNQLYEAWELCIVDDASSVKEINEILREYSHQDVRIKANYRTVNGGISACTNNALKMASGDWIVLMDHDDILPEHALYMVAEAINKHPDVAILYSDEDRIDENSRRFKPYFKSSFNYDLFLGQNMINHLGVYRADLVHRAGGFREGFDGSQDWDFALRVIDIASNPKIHHIPFILYHWRSTSEQFSTKSIIRAKNASKRAVNEHFRRTGQAAEATPLQMSSFLRIKRELPFDRPLVSIIIPTKNNASILKTCIDGLLNRTSYKPMEIVIVDNGSDEQDVAPLYEKLRSNRFVKIVQAPGSFNFSMLVNRGASESSGEILVSLNNDLNVINSDWLDEMVSQVLRPDVGAVGAKLYHENDTIQHAGVILGVHHEAGYIADYSHRGVPRSSLGYFCRLILTNEVSCVTAACLATRRQVFDELGGFDENNLTVFFNDIHFCLQARQADYKIIWTPHAELYHSKKISKGNPFSNLAQYSSKKAEQAHMRKLWGGILDDDPFYNPNLSLHNTEFHISHKPRTKKPWLEFAVSLWNLDPDYDLTPDITEALLYAAQQRLNASVADRLGCMESCKKEIEAYANTRCSRRGPKNSGKIAIYTAISGDYDSIKIPAHLDARFDYILFTDTPAPNTGVWQARPFPEIIQDPTRMARYVKTHPHHFFSGYDIAVWIDANIMILGDIYPLIQDFILSGKSVAAVPHALRKHVQDEFSACIRSKIDETSIIEKQWTRYKDLGFYCDELIESNVMMFKPNEEKVGLFLDTWWSEIECYSKRDQLSLNFALSQHGIQWHRITKRPNSIRNHPLFVMVRHDKNQGPARQLVDALKSSTLETISSVSTAPPQNNVTTRCQLSKIALKHVTKATSIDIVVPVYNALGDVKNCLASIEKFTDGFNVSIIVVNDGSDKDTTQWLRDRCKGNQLFKLIEHPSNQGYTKSVNTGLKNSAAPYIITQNSDTIVTAGWLKRLVCCIESDPNLGVVGPVSNAASWQNVPFLKDEQGNFTVNELPPGLDVDSIATIVAEVSERRYPRIPFVNGFCFMIRRSVITTIGYMDEVNFPMGYGEENDFCIRLIDAGFKMAIADDVFVYHAKSKSFGHDFRMELSKQGGEALSNKHGAEKVRRAVEQTKKATKLLDPLRTKLARFLYQTEDSVSKPMVTDSKHSIEPFIKPTPAFGTKEYHLESYFSGPVVQLSLETVNKSNNSNWPFSIGIHLHLYYLDLLDEFADYLSNVPVNFSLYVSVVNPASVSKVQTYFGKYLKSANVMVKAFENKGRDIAALIAGFGSELSRHDIICHIHSKRSQQNLAKRDWRRQLLHNLLGSRTYVSELLSLFAENSHIGMVFPEYHWALKEQIGWGTNFSECQKVASRIGVDINEFVIPLFPAGSMFWARSEALIRLLHAGINYGDFPVEDEQVDGTLAHAVERLFGAIVQSNGFDLLQIRTTKPYNISSY